MIVWEFVDEQARKSIDEYTTCFDRCTHSNVMLRGWLVMNRMQALMKNLGTRQREMAAA
jgi:hypothetical protein